MGYTKEQIEKLSQLLKAMPDAHQTKEHSKQEVIRLLARELTALQRRGYSLVQLAESLKNGGVDIATPTLKSYLQRAKPKLKTMSGTNIVSTNGDLKNMEKEKIEVQKKFNDKNSAINKEDVIRGSFKVALIQQKFKWE